MILSLKDVTIPIHHHRQISHVSIAFKPGESWGVIGPNGTGKTTFLQALRGFIKIDHGTICLNGKAIKDYSNKDIAKKIGFLFQHMSFHFPQSVKDYCKSGRYPHAGYFSNKNEDELLLQECLEALDLTTFKNRSVLHLSGGEKQRLAIATLLAQAPNIYLLDEPINHLDIKHQKMVLNLFEKLITEGHTVITAFHDLNIAANFCDHIILLFPNGKIKHGLTDEVLNPENLSELFGLSIGKKWDTFWTYTS